MRHRVSVTVVGLTVFCFTVFLAVASERPATAADQEVTFPDGTSFISEATEVTGGMSFAENETWTAAQTEGRSIWIVDDFEDGNIDGWVDEGGGACTASTSAIAASGAYSMQVDGACGHALGRVYDFNGGRPTGVSVWVRADTVNTYDSYFILGDSLSGPGSNLGGIYFYGVNTGDWAVFNGTVHWCGTRNPNQWYKVDFIVDWSCKMFDVNIDGVRKQTNVPFYHTATESFDRIHVYNYSSATARYDLIKFSDPGVSPLIFADNFERGSTCRWSS